MAEKRWDIILEWYRGEVTDQEFERCFWTKGEFPSDKERMARKPFEKMDLEELQAELKFLRWWECEFGPSDDDGTERMNYILNFINEKKK